ncbi:stAR-related lipid transfer protein 5-like [Saccoglossus kowalevskii]|uniref:StAR-related lipid transfer protein 5-like n=1 Tax=Saccoglossus kowalevskii TaxID=10224 RepID=A0ABM0MWF2_SACKO|nr:PREDICTED: stAR-related lipid transfer protein 5-like [Saccoglossus kowalevskii]
MTDYKAIADGVIEKLFEFEKATDWTKAKETREITTFYKHSPELDGRMFKMEFVIDAPAEKVVDVIMDIEKHQKWNSSIETLSTIEQINEVLFTLHNNVSVDHPACPPVKKYVRARNYPSGHLLYKGDPNKTRLVNINQSEMHLSPKALVERLIPFLVPVYFNDLSKGVKEL